GDTIVSVGGTAVTGFADASAIIRDHPGDALDVVVERDGADVSLVLTPVLATNQYVDDSGRVVTGEVGFAGFSPTSERVRQPIWAGTEAVFAQMGAVANVIA